MIITKVVSTNASISVDTYDGNGIRRSSSEGGGECIVVCLPFSLWMGWSGSITAHNEDINSLSIVASLSLSRFKVTAITLAPKSLMIFGRFCSATRCHTLAASGERRMPTPLDPLFEVGSWPAPRKIYPCTWIRDDFLLRDCSRHVSERQMANALRHCAAWTSSVRRVSVFNPRQFCANTSIYYIHHYYYI